MVQDPHPPPRDPLTKLSHPHPPLIGLAHGSRHPESGLGIERLMAAVAEQARIPAVPAYLDLAQPDLSAAAGSLPTPAMQRQSSCPCCSRRRITPPSMFPRR